MVIYESEHLKISLNGSDVYIQVFVTGLNVNTLNEILTQFPRVKITSFMNLQHAVKLGDGKAQKIGTLRPKVEIEVSPDEMSAFAKVNISEETCKNNPQEVVSNIVEALKERGVVSGIIQDAIKSTFSPGRKVLIAKGKHPVPGSDAKYTYYKLSDKKPELSTSGNADHYELNLINNVKTGDWLGEKIKPQIGETGMTVLGNELPPKTGRDYKLKYDKKTVNLVESEDKQTLYAKLDGAVQFKDGKITVENHLFINDDVDYNTGNIRFDGYVTIKGTVKDKFSVEATKDIEILAPNGIGAVARIESKEGSIFIRGGVNGKNEAVIIAKEDIFAKFSNEACLIAGSSIQIGLYAIESMLKASEIKVDPTKGRIIGGEIYAKHKIVSGSIGNTQERKTKINVEGFERKKIKDQLDALKISFTNVISDANRLKRKLEVFELNMDSLDQKALNTYNAMMIQHEGIIDEINRLNREVVKLESMLRTRGDGEINIFNAVFPKTHLEIKSLQKYISELMTCSFYVKDHQLHTAVD